MANPLSDPNAWVDENSITPPARWDGVAYEWFGVFGVGQPAQFIDYTGSMGTVSDTFAVSVSTGTENFSVPHVLRVIFNGSENQDRPLTPSTTEEFTFTKPATLTSIRVQVISDGETYPYAYSMDVAVTPIAQVDVVRPPYIIRGTHRAYMGVDTPQQAWIRDEAGQHDLAAYEALSVQVKDGNRECARLTLDATGDATGKLQFTITADGARTRLGPGTYNLFAYGDGQVIYTGLLEVLA